MYADEVVGSINRTSPWASVNMPDGTGPPTDPEHQVLQPVDHVTAVVIWLIAGDRAWVATSTS